jgi:predicted RNA-binding Zn ribbon-like protein
MKNLEFLKTGHKPAPGELVIVQGFVNTLDKEAGVDMIESKELLKAWLVRHGLLQSSENITVKDHLTVLSFREGLRRVLQLNNGKSIEPVWLRHLNQLAAQYPLGVSFKADSTISLSPVGHGMGNALGQIFAQIIRAVGEGIWFRLKACHEPNCQWAFYDTSKNRSGRWCSMSVCGSRVKARAYRKRRSSRR